MDLRWHGHALHAHTLVLAQQCNDSMERLEGMDDREAREVLKSLVQEYRAVNDSLAAFLARMSNANQGLVEMLQKSEEGRSSLMMRRAAEMLVKVRSSLCAPAVQPVRGVGRTRVARLVARVFLRLLLWPGSPTYRVHSETLVPKAFPGEKAARYC